MLGPLGPRRVPGRRDWLPGGRAQGRPLGGVATSDAERLAFQVAPGAAVEEGGDLAWEEEDAAGVALLVVSKFRDLTALGEQPRNKGQIQRQDMNATHFFSQGLANPIT